MEIKKRVLFLILLTFISFIFIAVGTASNSWVKKDGSTKAGKVTWESGLWKSCTSTTDCYDYTGTSDWIRSCRAMSIISCLLATIAIALSALFYVEDRIKGYMIGIVCVCSGVTMIIALVVFIAKNVWTNDESFNYSWSFIVSWLGVILSLISAVWGTMMSRF